MSINETASPDEPLLETYPDSFELPPPPSPPLPEPVPADNPPWGVLEAVIVWVTSLVLLAFVPLLVSIPYVIYRQVTGGSMQHLEKDPTLIFVTILGVVPAHILTFLVAFYVVTKARRLPFWSTLGWNFPKNFGMWKTIGLAVLLYAAGIMITKVLGGAETSLDEIIKSSLQTRFATAFLAAVTAPLVEEVVYRGVIYSALQRALNMKAAVVIVSALFAGVHVWQYKNNLTVISIITLLSVCLTWARARSGSLLPSYLIHLIFNGIQAIFLIVEPFVRKPVTDSAPVPGFLLHALARFFT